MSADGGHIYRERGLGGTPRGQNTQNNIGNIGTLDFWKLVPICKSAVPIFLKLFGVSGGLRGHDGRAYRSSICAR
jgi:hypothetical protein